MADTSPNDQDRELIDAYLANALDAGQMAELEALLKGNDSARAYFARYAQMHSDLALEAAARTAAARALALIPESVEAPSVHATPNATAPFWPRSARWVAAASLLIGMSIGGVVGLFAQSAPRVPSPVRRSMSLDFRQAVPGTVADRAGVGAGFPVRLPGTGSSLGEKDPNLLVDFQGGGLLVQPTASDLNTQFRIDQAEYPGIRLSDLGFTGSEDFEVSFAVADIPSLAFVGQFGVYVGSSSKWAFRGGLVSQRDTASYRQFVVNTRDGRDKDAYFVGVGAPGDDLLFRLTRTGGKYTMAIENRTTGTASILVTRQPEFLDGASDLVAGLFASEPRGKDHAPVRVSEFSATVWALPARTTP